MMIRNSIVTNHALNRITRNYRTKPPHIAIIGSGLAGFYTARELIKNHSHVKVDIYESSPIPFGLIRFGVAPDHPEVKNVIGRFTRLAESDRFRFFGNICLGHDITLKQLKSLYNGIVLAYGAGDDKRLVIPGEDLKGVHSAREFVGWYNGVPNYTNLNPDLSGETAVIIGQGNVALDVARITLTPIELLQKTDICSHAIRSLSQSNIKKLIMIGRRGPMEVSFTVKEFRRLLRLPQCHTLISREDVEKYEVVFKDLCRKQRKIIEVMLQASAGPRVFANDDVKKFELKFFRSPVKFLPSPNGTVQGVALEINKLETSTGESVKAVGTGKYETIDCSLIIRSIGYKSLPVDPDIPFNYELNIIPNMAGRVINNGKVLNGIYCSGWIKRGPAGAILNTMNDAIETAESIIEDINKGKVVQNIKDTDGILNEILKKQAIQTMSFDQWKKIDKIEQRKGSEVGKPREKIVSVKDMLETVL